MFHSTLSLLSNSLPTSVCSLCCLACLGFVIYRFCRPRMVTFRIGRSPSRRGARRRRHQRVANGADGGRSDDDDDDDEEYRRKNNNSELMADFPLFVPKSNIGDGTFFY